MTCSTPKLVKFLEEKIKFYEFTLEFLEDTDVSPIVKSCIKHTINLLKEILDIAISKQ